MTKPLRVILKEISDKVLNSYVNRAVADNKKDRSVGIRKAINKIMDRESPDKTNRYKQEAKLYTMDISKASKN